MYGSYPLCSCVVSVTEPSPLNHARSHKSINRFVFLASQKLPVLKCQTKWLFNNKRIVIYFKYCNKYFVFREIYHIYFCSVT